MKSSLPVLIAEQIGMDYADCPVEGCGEAILLTELDSHLDMHALESASDELDDDFNVDGSAQHSPCFEDDHVSKEFGSHALKTRPAFETSLPSALRNIQQDISPRTASPDRQETAKAIWRGLLKMPPSSKDAQGPLKTKAASVRLGVGLSPAQDIYNRADSMAESGTRTLLE